MGRAWGRLLANDIGLVRLDAAVRMFFCLAAGIAAGYAVSLAVGLPPFIGMMIGALPAFLSCLIVVDRTWVREAGRSALLLVPFAAALLTSAALRESRVLELVLLVGMLFVQFYAARFGTVAGDAGIALFAAYLCGLLLPLPTSALEKLVLVTAAALGAAIVVRALFFRPRPVRSLLRVRRTFLLLSADVLAASADLCDAPAADLPAARRRLRARLDRLRETALVADGLLGEGGSSESAPQRLAELLFDTELAVEGVAAVATTIATGREPGLADLRETVATALRSAAVPGPEGIAAALAAVEASPVPAYDEVARVRARLLVHLTDLADSGYRWRARHAEIVSDEAPVFDSSVTLVGGRPKGSAAVLEDALSAGDMSGPWSRLRMSVQLRTAIQAAAAVAVAEPLALLTGGSRYYWAVIGVLVTFAGTSSVDERVRKAGRRIGGTVVGGVIGIALVVLIGDDHPMLSLAVVLVAAAVGTWAIAAYYGVWVVCLVVLLCQVYVHAGMFTDGLLVLRLVENGLGAVLAVLVSLVVLPVRTQALVERAVRRHLDAVAVLVEDAGRPAVADGDRLRADARAVDHALFQLGAVLDPLVRMGTTRPRGLSAEVRLRLDAVTAWCRRMARHAPPGTESLPPEAAARLAAEADDLVEAVRMLGELVGGTPADRPWPGPSAPATDLEPDASSLWLAERLHLLGQVREALALVAEQYGVERAVRSAGRTP